MLHDPTRGKASLFFGLDGNGFTSTTSDWDLQNEVQDEVALDAHCVAPNSFMIYCWKFQLAGLGWKRRSSMSTTTGLAGERFLDG
ncbi:MAG: hypothetical protein R2788_13595 [Saprospiraceae bacterium]